MSNQIFRPYLSLLEIEYILSKLTESDDPESASIRKKLQPLVIKANAGLIKPSYIPTPRKGLKDSLGFTYQDEQEARYLNGEMSEEEEREYEASLLNLTKGV